VFITGENVPTEMESEGFITMHMKRELYPLCGNPYLPSLLVTDNISLSGQVLLGNREWMSLNGVTMPGEIEQQIRNFEEHGQTVVLAAVDGRKVVSKSNSSW